ncbi:hypothetical protein [Paraglaciecola hydrolytica]|uniref:DUF1524 domain-containing protein n=1 Tax=Paraglaciecola hydrolytica TaxID=1799789 RepID=A0A135ZZQ4_9ALTE|nr:hypothetical protein [Paraglaciecola hydrolytica]KXI28427.1 hypothetical protein AX660_15100 [Paraglaciecola hydrolytica]
MNWLKLFTLLIMFAPFAYAGGKDQVQELLDGLKDSYPLTYQYYSKDKSVVFDTDKGMMNALWYIANIESGGYLPYSAYLPLQQSIANVLKDLIGVTCQNCESAEDYEAFSLPYIRLIIHGKEKGLEHLSLTMSQRSLISKKINQLEAAYKIKREKFNKEQLKLWVTQNTKRIKFLNLFDVRYKVNEQRNMLKPEYLDDVYAQYAQEVFPNAFISGSNCYCEKFIQQLGKYGIGQNGTNDMTLQAMDILLTNLTKSAVKEEVTRTNCENLPYGQENSFVFQPYVDRENLLEPFWAGQNKREFALRKYAGFSTTTPKELIYKESKNQLNSMTYSRIEIDHMIPTESGYNSSQFMRCSTNLNDPKCWVDVAVVDPQARIIMTARATVEPDNLKDVAIKKPPFTRSLPSQNGLTCNKTPEYWASTRNFGYLMGFTDYYYAEFNPQLKVIMLQVHSFEYDEQDKVSLVKFDSETKDELPSQLYLSNLESFLSNKKDFMITAMIKNNQLSGNAVVKFDRYAKLMKSRLKLLEYFEDKFFPRQIWNMVGGKCRGSIQDFMECMPYVIEQVDMNWADNQLHEKMTLYMKHKKSGERKTESVYFDKDVMNLSGWNYIP